ncbi:MAG: S4 domain-containing protein [Thermaceae bacterium]
MDRLLSLLRKARGGRVVRTPFLSPSEEAWLRERAQKEGLKVAFFGGFPWAERRCAVIYPEEVPGVADPVEVVYLEEPPEPSEYVGEVVPLEEGVLAALLPEAKRALLSRGVSLRPPPEGALQPLKEGVQVLVVPSLRVDVLGAKGFGVSRTYFQEGVKAGKVRLKGRLATPKDELAPGDILFAEGLGVLRLLEVLGSTRKGRLRVRVERARP